MREDVVSDVDLVITTDELVGVSEVSVNSSEVEKGRRRRGGGGVGR